MSHNHRGVTPRADLAAGSSSEAMELMSVLKDVEKLPESSSFRFKEVNEIIQSTARIVGDSNEDLMIRKNALKKFRSLCVDPIHHDQIVEYLRVLTLPLQGALKDLCREACLTVAYIAYQLRMKSEFFFEPLMPALFSLLDAKAEVVTITGYGTLELVYECVSSSRLIPPLVVKMNQSNEKEVRRAVCRIVKMILAQWPQSTIQGQAIPLQEVIKKGLTDADADAQSYTREALAIFQQMFPHLAQSILDTLDEPLQLVTSTSQNSSTLPKNPSLHPTNGSAHPPSSSATATPALSRQGSSVNSSMKRTNSSVFPSRAASPVKTSLAGRSTSAIDLQGANRAKQHHFSTMSPSASQLENVRAQIQLESPSRKLASSSSRSPMSPSKHANVRTLSPNVAVPPHPEEKDLAPARLEENIEEQDVDVFEEDHVIIAAEVLEEVPPLIYWTLEGIKRDKDAGEREGYGKVLTEEASGIFKSSEFTANQRSTIKQILFREKKWQKGLRELRGGGIICDDEILSKRLAMMTWGDSESRKKLRRTLVVLPSDEECELYIAQASWKDEVNVKVTHFMETTSREELEVHFVVTTFKDLAAAAQDPRKSVLYNVIWHRVVVATCDSALARPEVIHSVRPPHIYIVAKERDVKRYPFQAILKLLNMEPAAEEENVDEVLKALMVDCKSWLG